MTLDPHRIPDPTDPRHGVRTLEDDRGPAAPATGVTLRRPTVADGARVWELVRDGGVLELNTPYCYVMMCHHFAQTCLVAEIDGRLAGALVGFRVPERPDSVFVWQVGVARSDRGRGVATALLDRLVRQTRARFIEATVTDSNVASRALFQGVARRWGTICAASDGFGAELFPGAGHEAERAFRIGPFESRKGDAGADGCV